MNSVSYDVAVGTHVWAIEEPSRATEQCKHCGEWTKWRPEFKVTKVIVGGVSICVSKDGTTFISYHLLYDNNFSHYKHDAKVGKDFYLTREEAEAQTTAKQTEWYKNHGR